MEWLTGTGIHSIFIFIFIRHPGITVSLEPWLIDCAITINESGL
jgi:hypothetical protein